MNGFVNCKTTKLNYDTIVLVLDCYYVRSRATAEIVKVTQLNVGFIMVKVC